MCFPCFLVSSERIFQAKTRMVKEKIVYPCCFLTVSVVPQVNFLKDLKFIPSSTKKSFQIIFDRKMENISYPPLKPKMYNSEFSASLLSTAAARLWSWISAGMNSGAQTHFRTDLSKTIIETNLIF